MGGTLDETRPPAAQFGVNESKKHRLRAQPSIGRIFRAPRHCNPVDHDVKVESNPLQVNVQFRL